MTATNMNQLKQMIMKKVQKAMVVSQEKMLADMYDETGNFYTGREPKVYKRTGALGDTPRITTITTNSNSVSFEAYLDQKHQYTTGSNPNMLQVLRLANSKVPFYTKGGHMARATVGRKGFWERANKKMKKSFNNTMRRFFR